MKWIAWLLAGGAMMIAVLGSGCAGGKLPLLYVGKYNDRGGAGFQVVELDPGAGLFRLAAEVEAGANPSYFCIDGEQGLIHAINEVDELRGQKTGGITTLALDAASGALRRTGEMAVPNGGPCYISRMPAGDYLLVANYGGGSVAVVRLDARGMPAAVTDTLVFQGVSGRTPRAHMIAPGPDGNRIYLTDLGLDRIMIYELDRTSGKLQSVNNGEVALVKGAGPRHFTFSKDGSTFYVINERNSTVTVFAVDAAGLLEEIQSLSTLPEGFSGTSYCADLHLGKSGRFLYGTNRGHNSIVTFRVVGNGRLELAGHTPCGGDWPRNFVIDPSGRYLVVANQRSHNLALFAIDSKSGLPLLLTAAFTTTSPACLKFALRPGESAGGVQY